MLQDADALPQPIGDYKPLDQWQSHVNDLVHRLRGHELRRYYQTFATADYRLAHALAADYYERVCAREKNGVRDKGIRGKDTGTPVPPYLPTPLIIHEWGCVSGNLAACFLSHLKHLDRAGTIYPRIRYVLVHAHQGTLDEACAHPDLAQHSARVETLCAHQDRLDSVQDRTVDRIICNELWNGLATKLMVRKDGEIEEEHLRPNLNETKHAAIGDWSGFVRAFDAKDSETLDTFPVFFDDLVWEKEYHKVEWKDVPYRKTITEFLKRIDEQVLVPVNLGAMATIKEAKRVLAPDAIGFSSFDAGTADLHVLNDPEKPCYGLFGGQYSFMINFTLVEAVAKQLGVTKPTLETQREFVGRSLNTNVLPLVDLLAVHPSVRETLSPWQQDRLTIKTMHALNRTYRSPYRRAVDFSLHPNMPAEERESLQATLSSLKPDGVPDTVAYLTEEELLAALTDLESIGYERDTIMMALNAPPGPIEYHHFSF